MRHLSLGILLASVAIAFAQDDSTSNTTESIGTAKIDDIQFEIGDAFDDSKYHTKYDKWVYDILNVLHIESQESTIRKLLLFDPGDTIDSLKIIEAERFLRAQKFLSDASITVVNENGRNIAKVKTSDNWTLTPLIGLNHPGNEWTYGIGVQESNFLGLGNKIGFYYGHDELRDMYQLEYGAPHFLFRYNQLDMLYSYNTDGYLISGMMNMPFLSRSKNQWAYTVAGLKSLSFAHVYGSGDMPMGAVPYQIKAPADSLSKYLKKYKRYNGKETVELMKVEDFRDDSLSIHLARSFGGAHRKLYLGATYDYRRTTAVDGKMFRYIFRDGNQTYALDSATAWNEWLPDVKDSRPGFYLMINNFRYEKIKNFHNVKWTEDIQKGYSLKFQLSKNYEQLASNNNDIRMDFWGDMYLGTGMHHLTLQSNARFYLDHGKQHDFYGKLNGEYIFHPTNALSTAIKGVIDFYEDTPYGIQLSLGGADGFTGFPVCYYTGQARVYGSIEQRWFPNFEVATLVPVFTLYGSVGETAWDFDDINRKDLIYVLGIGARFVQTKSISRIINKADVSVPLNGARKGDIHYSITTAYTL
ncbi:MULTISPECIES: hypothetical protein [unclassified Fibrobacter]|uniref:hypothetical protein n=1 Tax=unclassified Fibrobacter TaxID=2634177 RepID=UPI000D6D76E1|nr:MULTISPECIES: hypothetical protein [unclassified Fibrobacter]PWJ71725.1 hypothetical protein BGX12_10289 [Fibrobacter sp. UWR4]PZW74050.1 hypothetical protein C8E88_100171 [Fibrobacter sp. UWR1]